uniref:Uncharacterized protein n=1 Tax=viral metagenome TaxID=1070528 RepID=A0A6C0K5F9_9ZZZZ
MRNTRGTIWKTVEIEKQPPADAGAPLSAVEVVEAD